MDDDHSITEKDQMESVQRLLTDEVSYRVYVLSTFHDINQKLKYQGKLLETHTTELGEISDDMGKLLSEHAVCTKRVNDTLIYEDTWKWTKRVKEIWMLVTQKAAVWLFLAVAALLFYLYMMHVRPPSYLPMQKPPQVQQPLN